MLKPLFTWKGEENYDKAKNSPPFFGKIEWDTVVESRKYGIRMMNTLKVR